MQFQWAKIRRHFDELFTIKFQWMKNRRRFNEFFDKILMENVTLTFLFQTRNRGRLDVISLRCTFFSK